MSLCDDLSSRAARLVFALMMVLAWSGGVRGAGGAEPAADRVSRCFDAIEAVRADIPRESFDFSAIVRQTGNDPSALAAWVREKTSWTPYVGSLRGPLGVLMDRQGNDLDRAMLLAELLRTADRTVRLARADRSDEQISQLLGAQQPAAPPATTTASEDLHRQVEAAIEKYLAPLGLATEEAKQRAQEMLIQSERVGEDIVDRATKQSAALDQWVGRLPAGDSVSESPSSGPAQALREHWWVQYQEGEDWRNLDVSLAAPADEPAPSRTVDWRPEEGRWPIDDSSRHQVEVRLVIEQWKDGKLAEQTVLRQTLTPAELIGQPISLTHIPQAWPADLNLFAEPDPAAKIKSLALDEHEWLPVLRVGARAFYEGSFTDTAAVNPKADLGLFKKTGKSVGGAAGAAVDLFGDAPPAAVDTGILSAEWIVYVIHSPGRPAVEIRRQLFDLTGPAARAAKQAVPEPKIDELTRLNRSLALMGQTEILPLVCQLSPAFVDELTARRALALRDSVVELYSEAQGSKVKEITDRMTGLAPVPGRLYDLALARGALGPHQDQTCLQQINILSSHQFLRANRQGEMKYVSAIDIVHNPAGVRTPAGAERDKSVRLAQGVLDTAAEALLMEEGGRAGSASDLLSSRAENDQWLVVRRADEEAWKRAAVSADVRARVEEQLGQGYIIVLPRNMPAGGEEEAAVWWRIDPGTGQTLGMNGWGWGATMVEYALTMVIFFDACMIGGIAATGGDSTKAAKAGIVCALGAIGLGAGAAAGATAFSLKLLIAAAAAGGSVGYAL